MSNQEAISWLEYVWTEYGGVEPQTCEIAIKKAIDILKKNDGKNINIATKEEYLFNGRLNNQSFFICNYLTVGNKRNRKPEIYMPYIYN